MIIIHAVNNLASPFPRYLTESLRQALKTFPVVVTGARQTGKSTLIRELLPGPARDYRTLDDLDVLERAGQLTDRIWAVPLTTALGISDKTAG